MKNRNIVKIIIAILVLIIVIIGGIVYMGYKEQKIKQQEQEKMEVQRESVLALKNTFIGINEVRVLDFYENPWPVGGYTAEVKMSNDRESIECKYDYGSNSDYVTSVRPYNEVIQKKGKTVNKIKVIYTNGKEEVV